MWYLLDTPDCMCLSQWAPCHCWFSSDTKVHFGKKLICINLRKAVLTIMNGLKYMTISSALQIIVSLPCVINTSVGYCVLGKCCYVVSNNFVIWLTTPQSSVNGSPQEQCTAVYSGFLLGFTHTPASYSNTSMASNIRNRPITPGLLYVLPIGVA